MLDAAVLRQELIQTALPDACVRGWSMNMLETCEKKAGMEKGTAALLFPRGVVDAVDAFALWADQAMLDGLNQSPFATMGTTERITCAVRKRLEALAPYKDAERSAIGILALPPHLNHGPKLVWRTADTIWNTAGDTATDYNRYTKRFLLSSVLSKTTLYWLADDSDQHRDSWDFLDRQIGQVLRTGKALSRIKKPLDTALPLLRRLSHTLQKKAGSRAG